MGMREYKGSGVFARMSISKIGTGEQPGTSTREVDYKGVALLYCASDSFCLREGLGLSYQS